MNALENSTEKSRVYWGLHYISCFGLKTYIVDNDSIFRGCLKVVSGYFLKILVFTFIKITCFLY